MQTLEIISINLWHVLISLANLILLFLIVKRFLFKPVMNLFEQRKAELDGRYAKADEAQRQANEAKAEWEAKLSKADEQADNIIKDATQTADYRAAQIVEQANAKAEDITQRAETEASLTLKKAQDEIKQQIVQVSTLLTEKMLQREVNTEDHRAMIDSFIDDIGNE